MKGSPVKTVGRKIFSLYLWHRLVGLLAAVGVVWLAITGLLIAHSGDLGLESRYLSSDLLIDGYGLQRDLDFLVFAADGQVYSGDRHCLYRGTVCLPAEAEDIAGATALADGIAVATTDALYLFDRDGALIERFDPASSGLPSPLRRIGIDAAGKLVIDNGTARHAADVAMATWTLSPAEPIQWSAPATLAPAEIENLAQARRRHAINWLRVVRDAHSGWLGGRSGRWLLEGVALLMLTLVASGLGLWIARRRRGASRGAGSHRPGAGAARSNVPR
ncbi:MAG: PepSY domain-containing protein [Betaproteobacteria bacterium]|nr:PepSY domain-containing protein [Betaproteobacteria bacterium]